MKKKIVSMLGVLSFVLMLGACGTEPSEVKYGNKEDVTYSDIQEEVAQNVFYVASLANYLQSDELSDDDITQLEGYGFTETQINASCNWYDTVKEYGACKDFDVTSENAAYTDVDVNDLKVAKAGKTVTADLELQFGKKDVEVEIVYDAFSMDITGVTLNPIETLGHTLKLAGLNTLISMSIVFAVLILISLIISCFKIFPYLEEKKKKAQISDNTATEDTTQSVVEQIEQREQLTDDSELIAVIAAAIAASEGTSTSDFVVRSINRR